LIVSGFTADIILDFALAFCYTLSRRLRTQSEDREMKQTAEQIVARWRLLNHQRCDLIQNFTSSERPVGLALVGRRVCNNTHAQAGSFSWWWLVYWLIVLG